MMLCSAPVSRGKHMKNQTDTLGIGSIAPSFTLPAVNRTGMFSLPDLLARGALIIEFLRGTW
jgi:hypothetical protein